MTKYIFVVGGVISGVGKGVATASIGKILQEYGFNVTAIKIDPYINCDAGTLRPTEHGEVWVTNDGGEIDQDLGTYERFLSEPLSKKNSITTGQVYRDLIEKERRGDFLGETVQYIPHVPNEITSRIYDIGREHEIVLIEIGGTVGDYENVPFLFAAKNMENKLGKENVCYLLVTYMPIPSHIEEMKTKPTQLAIKLLRENGIQPDFILCRGKNELDDIRRKKIEQYSHIPSENIISMPDVTGAGTVNTLYAVPLFLEKEQMGRKLLSALHIEQKKQPDWEEWSSLVEKLVHPSRTIEIAVIGKYLATGNYTMRDSYLSISEALQHAGSFHNARVNINWVAAQEIIQKRIDLSKFDGILVPGGFGNSGVEGKLSAVQFARERDVPYLGLCFGLQLAVVEFAQHVCNLDAHSSEINPNVKHKVVDILPEQQSLTEKGGTMRLGSYCADLKQGSKIRDIYGAERVFERHRHRYEVNPLYHEILQKNGLAFSGMSPDGKLIEFCELPGHRFFVATQAHPEFQSSLLKPAPLFTAFVEACVAYSKEKVHPHANAP